jgi:C4-dicarboxylate-binding protein DctP
MKGRCFFFVFLLLLPATSSATAQQIKLRATLQGPVSNPFYGVSLVRFKEEVEKRSRNEVTIEIFDKGQLYRDDQVVAAVSSGAIDIGITAAHNFADRVPAVAFIDQPFMFNFTALLRAAASPDSEIRRLIDEAILADTGMRILWWQSLGDNAFFSKGHDVADPARIKDRTVGMPGHTLADFVTRCGGKASVVPVEKIEGAIRDGTLAMSLVALAAYEGRGLWKVTDTITRTAHAPLEFFLAINEKSWRSLSAGQQTIVAQAAREVEREARDHVSKLEAATFAFARSKGAKVQDLTPDQVAEWRACSHAMLAEYMDRNGERADQLMAAYAKLRTDPCCAAPPGTVAFTRH